MKNITLKRAFKVLNKGKRLHSRICNINLKGEYEPDAGLEHYLLFNGVCYQIITDFTCLKVASGHYYKLENTELQKNLPLLETIKLMRQSI